MRMENGSTLNFVPIVRPLSLVPITISSPNASMVPLWYLSTLGAWLIVSRCRRIRKSTWFFTGLCFDHTMVHSLLTPSHCPLMLLTISLCWNPSLFYLPKSIPLPTLRHAWCWFNGSVYPWKRRPGRTGMRFVTFITLDGGNDSNMNEGTHEAHIGRPKRSTKRPAYLDN